MDRFIVALLGIVGLINFLPVLGVRSAARIQAMYGVGFSGPDLAILLRHRAVLLAIVGGLLFAAMFRTDLRWPAIVAGAISMISFIALAAAEGGYNAAIRRVGTIDVVALVLLALAAALIVFQTSK